LYSPASIIRTIKSREDEMGNAVEGLWEKGNAYRILLGKPEGRPRHRWVDNIKIDLRQDAVIWTGLIWLRIWTSGWLL
jgi:hypothetical protein